MYGYTHDLHYLFMLRCKILYIQYCIMNMHACCTFRYDFQFRTFDYLYSRWICSMLHIWFTRRAYFFRLLIESVNQSSNYYPVQSALLGCICRNVFFFFSCILRNLFCIRNNSVNFEKCHFIFNVQITHIFKLIRCVQFFNKKLSSNCNKCMYVKYVMFTLQKDDNTKYWS